MDEKKKDRDKQKLDLLESEEKYKSLIERLNEAIYRMSLPDGKYDYFSPSVKLVLGYSNEEILNNPLLIKEVIHPDFLDYFKEKWADLLIGKVPPTYEYKIIDPEGNERWILQSNKGIFDNEGKIIAIEGICRNITERKKAELKLKESEKNLKKLNEELEQRINERTKELKESEEKYREAYNLINFYKDLFAHDMSNILQNIISSADFTPYSRTNQKD